MIVTTTGATDAVAYCSVAQADAYHLARGNEAWSALFTTDKEQALVRGCDFIGQTFGQRWAGHRVSTTQALDWPRYHAPRADMASSVYYPFDSIPVALVQANAEAALRAAAGELLEDIEPTVQNETVGPISTTYFQGASKVKKYPVIERLIAPLLASGGSVRMVRA